MEISKLDLRIPGLDVEALKEVLLRQPSHPSGEDPVLATVVQAFCASEAGRLARETPAAAHSQTRVAELWARARALQLLGCAHGRPFARPLLN